MKLHSPVRVAKYRARGWWSDDTVDALFRKWVDQRPDAPACADQWGTRRTWAELDASVDSLAAALAARGVGAGDVVGLQAPNSVALIEAFLAVIRLGAVVCPFPVQYRERELEGLAKRAGLVGHLTTGDLADRAHGVDAWVLKLDEARTDAGGRPPARPAAVDECVTICWTSGTESEPKGVPRAHCDWMAMAWPTVHGAALGPEDVLLNPFPMVNMAGIGGMLLPWLLVGCRLVQHQPFDLPTFLRQVAEERVTYTVAPPALLTMLLQRDDVLAAADLSSMRVMGSGSAPLPPAMVRGWDDRGIPIINFFGSNEGVALVSDPVAIPDPEERARFFPRPSLPGVEVRLVDLDTRKEIDEPGHPGELCIAGPTVFAGYVDGDTDPFDDDGFFCTGDVFEWTDDGLQRLHHVDRAKDIVIRGGMNISAAEVEGLLTAHPKVAEVAVVGVADDVLGERVCAVVVPREGEEVSLEDVVAFMREQKVASYKLPERIEVVDALPRNAVGKVLKRELRDRLTKVPSR